jgi:uncharacterized membrane protein
VAQSESRVIPFQHHYMPTTGSQFDPPVAIAKLGRSIYVAAIIALGVENIVCARKMTHSLGPQYNVIPVLPWLPSVSWLAYIFGAFLIFCATGLLAPTSRRRAAMILGTLLFLCAIFLDFPKYAVALGSVSLRTIAFEPLSLACLAFLLPDPAATPLGLARASRLLLGASMIIFGIDHFLALIFIANLIPLWIPFHVFWVAFFGVAFIAAGASIALNLLLRWGAFGLGLMFGIWVLTLHMPRVLGLYGIPGAPHNPNEWSSLFIAVALWGGLWAIARSERETSV